MTLIYDKMLFFIVWGILNIIACPIILGNISGPENFDDYYNYEETRESLKKSIIITCLINIVFATVFMVRDTLFCYLNPDTVVELVLWVSLFFILCFDICEGYHMLPACTPQGRVNGLTEIFNGTIGSAVCISLILNIVGVIGILNIFISVLFTVVWAFYIVPNVFLWR